MVEGVSEERPYGGASGDSTLKRVRTRHFQAAKEQGIRITGLTSYDCLSASIFDDAGIDFRARDASVSVGVECQQEAVARPAIRLSPRPAACRGRPLCAHLCTRARGGACAPIRRRDSEGAGHHQHHRAARRKHHPGFLIDHGFHLPLRLSRHREIARLRSKCASFPVTVAVTRPQPTETVTIFRRNFARFVLLGCGP